MTDDLLVFIHNPKAGGTTLFRLLEQMYPEDRIKRRNGPDLEAIAQRLPDDVQVVHGHLPYGIHNFVDRPVRYLTILREPVARAVSAYHYIRDSNPDHPLHPRIHAEDITLERFVREGMSPILTDNGQVRLISGQRVPFGGCTQEMLDRAKRNVDRYFAAAGTTERFDDFLVVCKHVLGWPRPPYYRIRKVGKPYPRTHELPGTTIDLIRHHNELDAELHAFTAGKLDDAIDDMGIQPEIAAFKRGMRARAVFVESRAAKRIGRFARRLFSS